MGQSRTERRYLYNIDSKAMGRIYREKSGIIEMIDGGKKNQINA